MSNLIIWPCCSEKIGIKRTILNGKNIERFLDGPSIEKLHEGRKENLEIIEKKGLAALDLYTGHLYSVFDFKNAVRGAVESKTHCLILSAGYGLIRAEEPIDLYNKSMNQALESWTRHNLIADVFSQYLKVNKISNAFITASKTTYAPALFYQGSIDPRFIMPELCEAFVYIPIPPRDSSPIREVPKMQGEAIRDLIHNEFIPDSRWIRIKS